MEYEKRSNTKISRIVNISEKCLDVLDASSGTGAALSVHGRFSFLEFFNQFALVCSEPMLVTESKVTMS
jgi:hypothetical protein